MAVWPTVDLYTVFLEVTNHCNFNCVFCPNEQMARPRGLMALALARRALDELASPQFRFSHLNLHLMGEPLLHPQIADIVAHAAGRGLKTVLNTNAALLTAARADALFDAGLTRLVLSYQTHRPDLFHLKRARRADPAAYHEQIRGAIRRKVARGAATGIEVHFLNTKHLRPRQRVVETEAEVAAILADWLAFAREVRAELGLPDTPPAPAPGGSLLDIPEEEGLFAILPGVNLRFKRATTFGNQVVAPGVQVRPATAGYCTAPFQQLGILWNGDCTACCLDYDGQIGLGNLAEAGSLAAVWYGERATALRSHLSRQLLSVPFCQVCQGRTNFVAAAP